MNFIEKNIKILLCLIVCSNVSLAATSAYLDIVEDIAGNVDNISTTGVQLNSLQGISNALNIEYADALHLALYTDRSTPTIVEIQSVIDRKTASILIPIYGILLDTVTDVVEPNVAPVATAQSVTVDEDTTNNVITLAGTDADGDTLTYNITVQPTHGTVTLNGTVATYTPTADYAGADSFSFTVNDGTANSSPATVSITVTDVAEPVALPILADVTAQTYIKNSAITALVFVNTGGAVTTCTVLPALSAGLIVTVNNDTCEITGMPTIVTAETNYTVTATNATGSDDVTITITVEDEVTIEEQVVERHNLYRGLDFNDSDLVWDETLATHAQQWATYIATNYTIADRAAGSPHASHFHTATHGLPYLGEGENIAWASSTLKYIRDEAVDITVADSSTVDFEFAAVDMWANEKAYYDYASNSGNGEVVGHYTQVVWQKTTKVGCGKATSTTDMGGEHVVCRYEIPGNMTGEKPYCSNYTVSDLYTDNSLVFSNAIINNSVFAITKVLEDRSVCTRSDTADSTLTFTGVSSASIPSYNTFNTADGSNLWPMNFDNIVIDGIGQLIMTNAANDRYMRLKMIGEDSTHYIVEAYWWVTGTQYDRTAILKLAK